MKKLICYTLSLLLTLCLAGCSWSVGTTPDRDDRSYDEIFTWGNESKVHTTQSYNIQLGEYGEVLLILDTSLGHRFELDGQTNTFTVTDKEGTQAVLGHFISQQQYVDITALYESLDIRNINNRDYAIVRDGSIGKYLSFTYLADCGMDVGLMMEAADDDSFKYLAFSGEPLENSSADIQSYLGHYIGTPQSGMPLPEQAENAWEVSFATGKGFNVSAYELSLLNTSEATGGNSYQVLTANSEEQNILEVAVKTGTNYTDAASSLADTLREQSGETPALEIHQEGAYLTGVYNGMLTLVFTADGTDGLTYMMSLYSNNADNGIDIFDAIIDDFLASGITAADSRTEYGEPVPETPQEGTQTGQQTSPDGFPAFTVPTGFSSIYEGAFVVSYSSDDINISIYSGQDDEFMRFLGGETDTYYDVYQMSRLGSCELTGYDPVIIAEGENTGLYVYFAGTENGSLNIQFSNKAGKQLSLAECEELLKQFIP